MQAKECIYRIKFSGKDETCKRCKLKGKYNLIVRDLSLCLYDDPKQNMVLKWPYQFIRRFTKNPDNFILETGRRCSCGEGTFIMETKDGLAIFTSMIGKIDTLRASTLPSTSSESSRSSVTTPDLDTPLSPDVFTDEANPYSEPDEANPYSEPDETNAYSELRQDNPSSNGCQHRRTSALDYANPCPIPLPAKKSRSQSADITNATPGHYMDMINSTVGVTNGEVQQYENVPPVRLPSVVSRRRSPILPPRRINADKVEYESMQELSGVNVAADNEDKYSSEVQQSADKDLCETELPVDTEVVPQSSANEQTDNSVAELCSGLNITGSVTSCTKV